jgi:23S rRNA (uracil1939-C5)-methyltransferase
MNKFISLNIESLDNEGYGIATYNNTNYTIKNSLPSEIAEIILNTNKNNYYLPNKLLNDSPFRATPRCKHFLVCGGCQLQHLTQKYYQDFKIQKVKNYLKKANYALPKEFHFLQVPDFSRRKVILTVNYDTKPIQIGFLQEFSKNVIPIEECIISAPKILQIIQSIKNKLSEILAVAQISQITITLADSGVDIILYNNQEFNLETFEKLRDFCQEEGISRLSSFNGTHYTLILENQPIEIIGKDYKIKLPLNYFLQATKECENIFKEKLFTYINDAKNILDLYSGFGTYSLLLAQSANVKSFEISAIMVQALNDATRLFPRNFSLIAKKRDLEKDPLSPSELNKFDYIIINPPRKGALSQIKQIANSNVKKIVIISCNPMTFSRDIYYLSQSKYQLTELTIIDQFLYSSHVEILALFTKS